MGQVPPSVRRHAPAFLAVAVWLAGAVHLVGWVGQNPLPDGFQNEYLHVGNAYDLWYALLDADTWHMRWFMYTGYWPWGFYAVPWATLGVLGASQLALVSGNLLHLAALCWGGWRLGRVFDAPLAPLLLALCPGVFGTLVRFEPNLATIAWTVAGVACLVSSRGLRERKWVMGWGACLGLGLMFDRLTVGFFLVPAVLPLALGAHDKRAWRHLAQAGLLTLFLTAAYYREFFLRHTDELLGQAPVGEIDAAGQVTVNGGIWPGLYYPLTLVDSQAGAVIGGLMLLGFGIAVVGWTREVRQGGWSRLRSDPRGPLLAAVVPAVVLFSLIAKKQVYYTLPILGPLAVLAATRKRLAWLGVVAGLHGVLSLGWGVVQDRPVSAPFLPRAWVSPRHTLAQPPAREHWPLDEAAADVLQNSDLDAIVVMSEDHRLYEGYLALGMRERMPGVDVRGVTTDPHGTYELLAEQDALVWVGDPGGGWPTAGDIEAELLADHYNLAELPPVADTVAGAAEQFEEVGRHRARNDVEVDIVVFRRVRADTEQ